MARLDIRRKALQRAGAVMRTRGFTLIELVIVVAIIAILAGVAVPTYINYITKTRRSAASGCLSQYANYMERYYTTNLRYDKDASGTAIALPTLDCAAASQTGDYYSYGFAASQPTQSTYTILAKPYGTQASRDTTCGTLGIDQAGQRYYQSTSSDTAGLDTCWK